MAGGRRSVRRLLLGIAGANMRPVAPRDMGSRTLPSRPVIAASGTRHPLKNFDGNFCTSAMDSFQTVGYTQNCPGVGPT